MAAEYATVVGSGVVGLAAGFRCFLARIFMRRWRALVPLRGVALMGLELLAPLQRVLVRRSPALSPPASRLASGLALASGERAHGG